MAALGDARALALTLWGEARGEDDVGMAEVAGVVLTRVSNPGWWTRNRGDDIPDDTIEAACRDPWQFSCWNVSDPNLNKMLYMLESNPAYVRALRIAESVMDGTLVPRSLVEGCDHYHAVGWSPSWLEVRNSADRIVDYRVPAFTHGRHMFYKIGLTG